MSTWTIGKKLLVSFGMTFALTLLLGVASLHINNGLRGELDRAVNVTAQRQLLAGKLSASAERLAALDRGIAFSLVLQQMDKAQSLQREFEQTAVEMKQGLQQLAAISDAAGGGELAALESQYASMEGSQKQFLQQLTSQQIDAALKTFDENLMPSIRMLSDKAHQLVSQEEKNLAASVLASGTRSTYSALVMLVLCGLTVPVLIVVFMTVRRITAMLRGVTGEISTCANAVGGASEQISESSHSMSDVASRQASSLEETSASSHEMSSLTQKNADASRRAATVMAEVDSRVRDANTTLGQMVASMREIQGSSEKIARIIKVIDEISFQTNILALNAAVEAARAGDAGMGFAVVADEVRRLAQRCAQAAKDTATLIEESITTSTEGSRKIETMAASVTSITESTTRVKQLVDELQVSSQEQAQGIEQISSALTDLENVTQKSAASAEQSASVSVSMSDQAKVMNDVVRRLVSMVGGESPERPTRERVRA